jgi:sugar phosphate isomerase/epimerase
MIFSLTTRWNAGRHTSGESMIEEILKLGIDHVELGYDLRLDLVPGVRKMVQEKAVIVDSLHNFCPVPVAAVFPGPEVFLLTSLDSGEREAAIRHTTRTIEFASEIGAKCVVIHAGQVEMKTLTRELISLSESGKQYDSKYDKIRLNLLTQREKKAKKHIEWLYKGIEALMPILQKTNVMLAFENLPYWEAVPCESEMEEIGKHFNSPLIRYWHDMGHGQIRENLGFIGHKLWLERLSPFLAGMHIHDVIPPAHDHLMPPKGKMNIAGFRSLIKSNVLLVLEPSPNTPEEDIQEGLRTVREAWETPAGNRG